MKRILHVLVLLMAMTSSTFAATDDIGLYVKDIILDWGGGGGTKDVDKNSFTTNQYATNYWDIHDLSTNVYDKVEFTFAQADEDYQRCHESHCELRRQQDTCQDSHQHWLGRTEWGNYPLLHQHHHPCQGLYRYCRYNACWLT